MKKALILASLLAFTMSTAMANTDTNSTAPERNCTPPAHHGQFQPPPPNKDMEARKAKFEDKLKLTDEQKAKAKEIRMKGHEEMKPIMEKIKAKRQQIDTIRKSRIAVQEQEKQIAAVREELKVLKKQAHELRIKNMQEFESILTTKQKKTLEKMKKEGRKNFKKNQQNRPCPPPPPAPQEK